VSFEKCLAKYDEPVVFWIKGFEYFLSLDDSFGGGVIPEGFLIWWIVW